MKTSIFLNCANNDILLLAMAYFRNCKLCGNPLKNGRRILEMGDGEKVHVCWSNCRETTMFLTEQTRHRLDESPSSLDGVGPSIVIQDEPFNIGYINYDPSRYEEFLGDKKEKLTSRLIENGIALPDEIESFASPRKFFRLRCRLGCHVKFNDNTDGKVVDKVTFLQWDEQGVPCIIVKVLPLASETVNHILSQMKLILEGKGAEGITLCQYLASIQVLSSLQGQAVLTFVYDKEKNLGNIESEWRSAASWFVRTMRLSDDFSVIGQSKGVRFEEPRGKDYVMETLNVTLPNDRNLSSKFFYKMPVDGFSNPNGHVNQLCLGWLSSVSSSLEERGDLLEMYSGCSNHTVALARYYNNVVCVELNKALCEAAIHNLALNAIHNAKIITGPSEKFAKSIMKRGTYKDKEKEYSFDTVLVDPPRGGLDADTRRLLRTGPFRSIIYISCSPDSLVRDLKVICDGHLFKIERFAVFDHFAYSAGHLESGVLLVRTQ